MELLNNEYNLIYHILEQLNYKIYKINNNLLYLNNLSNNTIYCIYIKLDLIPVNEIYQILLILKK